VGNVVTVHTANTAVKRPDQVTRIIMSAPVAPATVQSTIGTSTVGQTRVVVGGRRRWRRCRRERRWRGGTTRFAPHTTRYAALDVTTFRTAAPVTPTRRVTRLAITIVGAVGGIGIGGGADGGGRANEVEVLFGRAEGIPLLDNGSPDIIISSLYFGWPLFTAGQFHVARRRCHIEAVKGKE
jgi:hypothetical protein